MSTYQTSKPNNLVQTIERASSILDILGQSPQGISIRELSTKIKLPKGTTHRLLSSLSYFGYVRQDLKTRNYLLGLKLVELGQLLLGQLDLRKEAEPFLRDLAERTKETVHLVFLDRNEIVYIDKVETEQNSSGLKMASRVGLRNPAHSSAVGKVLLAHFSEEELKNFFKRPRVTINTYHKEVISSHIEYPSFKSRLIRLLHWFDDEPICICRTEIGRTEKILSYGEAHGLFGIVGMSYQFSLNDWYEVYTLIIWENKKSKMREVWIVKELEEEVVS
jgi:DNA-binding IclR family transcriptional regulator